MTEPSVEPHSEERNVLAVLREWLDALIIAFVLAMFIRTFLVELFKIPTGSMTPTLIGGLVARIDYNHDNLRDLVLYQDNQDSLFFKHNGDRLVFDKQEPLDGNLARHLRFERENDHILVNKFAFWFSPPRPGDITVFKVPSSIWSEDKPIYIKRTVGAPGDTLTFSDSGQLVVNGQALMEPAFFRSQHYALDVAESTGAWPPLPEVDYAMLDTRRLRISRIAVPENQIYVFGDNTLSSLDSRYWGGVPMANVKGRAFFRYRPLNQMKFLGGA